MFYASRVEEFSTDRFGKTKLTTNRWRGWRNSHRSDSNSRLNFFLKTARFPASSFFFSPLPSPAPPHPRPAQIQPCMTILALRGIPREEEHVRLVQQSRSYGNTFCVFVTPNIWGKYWTDYFCMFFICGLSLMFYFVCLPSCFSTSGWRFRETKRRKQNHLCSLYWTRQHRWPDANYIGPISTKLH